LCNPAYGSGQGKNAGKQVDWNTNGALHDAGIKVDIGVELALYKVIVFQGDFF
jgi:hypothetical protein